MILTVAIFREQITTEVFGRRLQSDEVAQYIRRPGCNLHGASMHFANGYDGYSRRCIVTAATLIAHKRKVLSTYEQTSDSRSVRSCETRTFKFGRSVYDRRVDVRDDPSAHMK